MAPSEANEPRSVITFHSPIRTFNRIFSENSLQEMKDAVRKKLGLSSASPIHLDHLQGEYCIALEDDDDFNAFHLLAKSIASLVVRVTVEGMADEVHNGGTISTATHLPPSDQTTSIRSRKRRSSISKAGFTNQAFRVIEYAGPSAETSMRGPAEHGKRKRIADEDSLKPNTGNNIALEPAPAADVTASPKRKKQKRIIITAGTSDSISDVDMLDPGESSETAPKERIEEVSDSTSKSSTSGDLHLSINTVKSKKGGKTSTKPDREDEADKDDPPAAAKVQVPKKKIPKKKAIEADSLHSASPLVDPDIPGASKSSAKKASRVPNTIKKSTGLVPEVPISGSLSTATKKGKKKKEIKTLFPNQGKAEETVVNAYDNFFRSGQESDHEVPSQATLSSKNAKKRPTEITKPREDSTNSNRIGRRRPKQSDAEKSKRPSTTEELEAAQATIRAAIAQRRKQAAVNNAATTDTTNVSKATSPIIADGPLTATVQVAEIELSSTLTSKRAKQSFPLKKVRLHVPLERHSSPAASTTEIDVFGPVTNPASAVKKGSGSGLKNNGRKSGSSSDKSSSSRDVPMKAMVSGDDTGDDEELRALIRGPERGRVDVGQILSVAAAGGNEDNVAAELEEDEDIQPRYRSFAAADASSSEEEIEDDDSPDVVSETDQQTSIPLVASSTSREPSTTDSNDAASKYDEQRARDDGRPVNSITVADTPEESPASPISPKPPTEPEPVSPIESFDEPQQTLQTHVESPPRRPNGLVKRMKGKSASLSPQQSRLRPPMLSKMGKLNRVSEEEADSEAQTIASQFPPTQPPALLEPIDFDNVPPVSSSKPRRQSLDTWATLKPSSPNTDPDSSINIDELVSVNYDEVTSSTPNDRRLAFQETMQQMAEDGSLDSHDSQPTDNPLFLPSESQHPFPYSQHQAVSARDSEDENEVEASVKSGPDVTASSFRRLTDIGNQRTFFSSQPPGWQKADFSRPTLKDLYGNGPDDESDSSDGDSEGGGERTSHIPQSRRAGAK